MRHLYRFLQGLCIITWMILLITCEGEKTQEAYEFTSHQITLKFQPTLKSFFAKDTIGISYKKKVNEVYFFLNNNLIVHNVRVGHQTLNYHRYGVGENRFFLDNPNPFDAKTVCYRVELPPSLNPHAIEIEYYGEYLDSLVERYVLPSLTGQSDGYITLQKQLMTAECWYPRFRESNASFQITVDTPGVREWIF